MIFMLNSDYFSAKIWHMPFKWVRSSFSMTYKPIFYMQFRRKSGPSSRAVWGVGLLPLACWDYRFESRLGHGCPSLVRVVCSQVEVSASGWSLVQRSPIECGVSECDRGEAPYWEAMSRHRAETAGGVLKRLSIATYKYVWLDTYCMCSKRIHLKSGRVKIFSKF